MKSFLHGPAVGVQSCAGQARKTQRAPRIPKVLPQKVPKPPLPCLWCPCRVWPLFLASHCAVPLPKRGSSAHAEPELRPLRALSVTQPWDLQERLCLGVSRCFSSCFAGAEPPSAPLPALQFGRNQSLLLRANLVPGHPVRSAGRR